jgi:hypothetical protein
VVDSSLSPTLGEPEALTAVQAALSSWSVAAPRWIFDANAIAVTLVTTDSDPYEILDADIALNIESHTFRVLPTPNGNHRFDDIPIRLRSGGFCPTPVQGSPAPSR